MSIICVMAKAMFDDRYPPCENDEAADDSVTWAQIDEHHREDYRGHARVAIEALTAAGYRIVPIEPTDAMCVELGHLERDSAREAWRNTLAVAPQVDVGQ